MISSGALYQRVETSFLTCMQNQVCSHMSLHMRMMHACSYHSKITRASCPSCCATIKACNPPRDSCVSPFIHILVCAQTPNNVREHIRETGAVCGYTRYRHLRRGTDFAGQAKVTKLARHVFEHENVGRFQVSVHYLNPMQILHTLFASVSGRWQVFILH